MIKPISPQQAFELISRGVVDVIDVRDPHEWIEGHVPTSRLIPLAHLRRDPESLVGGTAGLLFVCAAGVRSETAARLAVQRGHSQVYNLVGGTRAWLKAGLQLDHEPAVTAAE